MDLAGNNLQMLICQKTQPNETNHIQDTFLEFATAHWPSG